MFHTCSDIFGEFFKESSDLCCWKCSNVFRSSLENFKSSLVCNLKVEFPRLIKLSYVPEFFSYEIRSNYFQGKKQKTNMITSVFVNFSYFSDDFSFRFLSFFFLFCFNYGCLISQTFFTLFTFFCIQREKPYNTSIYLA